MRVVLRKALSVAVFVAALAASGAVAEDVLTRAREAASQDRHREAIRLYLEAVAIDSTLAPEVAVELGHQYTWAENADSAIIWYSRYLADHPGDMEASLGIARALSWAGRLDQAEVRYAEVVAAPGGEGETEALLGLAKVKAWREDREGAEAVYAIMLDRDSTNTDARLGLAEVMNWSGKHRRSRELCQEVLAREPDNKDATRILAEALYGLGRGDLAMDAISQAPPDKDLDRVAATIRGSKEPSGTAGYSYWENTDDGIFRSLVFSAAYPVSYLTELGGLYLRGTLHKQGLSDVTRDQFWFTLDHRFSETLAVAVKPGVELNRFSPVVVPPAAEAVDDFDLAVWDAYVTVTPRDWMRIDAGTFRETMKIHEPLFRRIHVTTENAGLDWRLTHRIGTFWQVKYSSYSDGNSRFAALHRGEWNPPVRLPYRYPHQIAVIEGVDYLNFSKTLDNGYYDPSSYVRPYLGLRLVTDINRRVRFGAEGQLGAEKESGSGWTSAGSFDIFVRGGVWGGSYVSAGYYQSGSRLDSPDGFRAEGVYVTLDLSRTP
jgi:tetratricopeptide (TPR) repeat protein